MRVVPNGFSIFLLRPVMSETPHCTHFLVETSERFYHGARRKFLLILFSGILCSFMIFAYMRRSQTPMENDEPYSPCIVPCEATTDRENIALPNYKLPLDFTESTCSTKATFRGRNQHVISFSFYGSTTAISTNYYRSYFRGIERNVKLIKQLYPGYVMRVYHDVRDLTEQHLLCQMLCRHWDILDTCFVGDLPGYGNLTGSQPNVWRFLAMSDPLVDVALSRDLDSNVNEREVAAVQEWLRSNATMHVMRDHPLHKHKMLGAYLTYIEKQLYDEFTAGMWGARINGSHRHEWRDIIERILIRAKVAGASDLDQTLLAEEVWSYASRPGWMLQHDSFYCQNFNSIGKMLAFPTERLLEPMNFVGARYFIIDSIPLIFACPLACRRQPNWTMC